MSTNMMIERSMGFLDGIVLILFILKKYLLYPYQIALVDINFFLIVSDLNTVNVSIFLFYSVKSMFSEKPLKYGQINELRFFAFHNLCYLLHNVRISQL